MEDLTLEVLDDTALESVKGGTEIFGEDIGFIILLDPGFIGEEDQEF